MQRNTDTEPAPEVFIAEYPNEMPIVRDSISEYNEYGFDIIAATCGEER